MSKASFRSNFQRATACIAGLLAAASTLAQSSLDGYIITVDPPVLAPGQTATITIEGRFDPAAGCALASLMADLLVSQHADGLHDLATIRPFGGDPGSVDPAGVRPLWVQQLTGLAGEPGDTRNPIPFWRASFTAPDTDRPLTILLATRTWEFTLNTQCCGHCYRPISRLDELDEAVATIIVTACRADLDLDGALTIFDFLEFQTLFSAGDDRADFDGDGSLTIFDFLAFQTAFDAGC
jgi:hypothetical protein